MMKTHMLRNVLIVLGLLVLSGCSAKIAGVVNLMDRNDQLQQEASVDGAVVNMINLDTSLDKASYSVITGTDGKFSSAGTRLEKGRYKIEVIMPGYVTTTMDVELGDASDKLVVNLKKIPAAGRRSYRSSDTDRDKIVNPGEVNIQPPSM